MREAADAMKGAFAALSAGEVVAPHRVHLPAKGSEDGSLLMGALLPGEAMSNVDAAWLHMEDRTNLMIITGVLSFKSDLPSRTIYP